MSACPALRPQREALHPCCLMPGSCLTLERSFCFLLETSPPSRLCLAYTSQEKIKRQVPYRGMVEWGAGANRNCAQIITSLRSEMADRSFNSALEKLRRFEISSSRFSSSTLQAPQGPPSQRREGAGWMLRGWGLIHVRLGT